MDASFWGPVWRELAADVSLLTPEFPGFGEAPPEDVPTVDGFADAVAEAIRHEAAGPATVVGLSLGGYVAQSLAARHPDTVTSLVLAGTKAEPDDEAGRRGREASIDTIRIDGLDAFLGPLLARLIGPEAGTDVWERADAIASRQDPDAVCQALEALRDRPDRRPDLARITAPAIVVVGADDEVTPLPLAHALADGLPEATLEVIPGAGHLSALERPEPFAAIVAAALARASA